MEADARDHPDPAPLPGHEGSAAGALPDAALPDAAQSVELVRRIQAGDARATDELLARYRPRLLRIVRVRLGRELCARLDDEDVVQEALLIAVARFPAFELRTHAGILGWLVGIAQRVVLKKRAEHGAERRDSRREVPLADSPSSTARGTALVASGTSPSSAASRAEHEALVDAVLETLEPPDYREAILLRDYLEHDWEEVRVRLERPTVAAAQELHRRAHQRLREALVRRLGLSGDSTGPARAAE